jgi:hypothetical protein
MFVSPRNMLFNLLPSAKNKKTLRVGRQKKIFEINDAYLLL